MVMALGSSLETGEVNSWLAKSMTSTEIKGGVARKQRVMGLGVLNRGRNVSWGKKGQVVGTLICEVGPPRGGEKGSNDTLRQET